MSQKMLAEYVASISEFKAAPTRQLAAAEGEALAVLNHNKPAFYCLPPEMFERLRALEAESERLRIALAFERRCNESTSRITLEELSVDDSVSVESAG